MFSVLSRHKCPNTLMQATLFNPPALLFTCTTIYPHKTLGYSICNKSRWDCTSVPLSLGSRKGGEGGRHKDSRTMSRSLATSIGSLSYNPDCKIIRPLSYNPAFPACKIIRPLWFILQSLSLRKSLKFVRTGNCSNGLLTFFKTIKGGRRSTIRSILQCLGTFPRRPRTFDLS